MKPHVVVDVGNTRIKWGRCSPDAVIDMASLPPDDVNEWEKQRTQWALSPDSLWVIAGVHPLRRERLAEWLRQRGERVRVVVHPDELPLRTLLAEPEKAGMDRLLDAVAANRRRTVNRAAVIVDAGSAVTVDWLDDTGAFAGGAILPGFRLLAKVLHDYTALLPLIELPHELPTMPGTSTRAAMELGIFWSVAGAIQVLVREYQLHATQPLDLFLTGGDAPLLQGVLPDPVLWPEMTLEGLRWTAETLS
jgi:type III pantothenate kinase